jgi:hypothetical protein
VPVSVAMVDSTMHMSLTEYAAVQAVSQWNGKRLQRENNPQCHKNSTNIKECHFLGSSYKGEEHDSRSTDITPGTVSDCFGCYSLLQTSVVHSKCLPCVVFAQCIVQTQVNYHRQDQLQWCSSSGYL